MISVIIPVYNSSQTLKECLDAIFSDSSEKSEVIVVSDNSKDNSIDIAKNYNCKIIELKENTGPGNARNVGANSATGDLLLFVDSDVVVKKDFLINTRKAFDDKSINVIQGIYSHEPNYQNTITQYQQSFYCYYTWYEKNKYTSTLVSMCFAIRKSTFLKLNGFNTNIKKATAEDEEFGYKLLDDGNQILISRELNVEHRVSYTLGKFIKRNFIMYVETAKSFIRNKSYKRKINQKNYTGVLMGIPLIALIIFTLVIMLFNPTNKILSTFFALNIAYLLLHLKFVIFVSSNKGIYKGLGVIMYSYLDTLLMLLGAIFANVSYILGKKY